MTKSDRWHEDVAGAIRAGAGDLAVEELSAEWARHAARKGPVVTVFGSYDSGKSSLIKRVLVDGGVTVPEWLTINARRDTFEVNEIDVLGCTLRDTPGIAAGEPEHERVARQALVTTDVILVATPPQLLTGDRDAVLAVARGEPFRSTGLRLDGALAFAVCKIDEGGYDPDSDLETYRRYADGKIKELAEILERARIDPGSVEAFAVAADPYQTVVNSRDVGPEVYDEFRSWDAMDKLETWLRNLPAALPALRNRARYRYWSAAAEAHCGAARHRLADVELGHREAQSDVERFTLLQRQLEALLGQARATLNAAAEEVLVTAARSRLDTSAAAESFVGSRLDAALGRWWDDQTAALDKLIAAADAEIEARRSSPGGRRRRRVIDDDGGQDSTRGRGKSHGGGRKAATLAEKARKALQSHHESKLGMKLEKAREELKKLDEAKTFGDYVAGAKRRKHFATLADAQRARKVVGFHSFAGTIGPVLVELGALWWEEAQREKLEKARADRRAALRDMMARQAGDIGDEAWKEWKVRADEFGTWLGEHKKTAEDVAAPLGSEREELLTFVGRLGELLHSAR